MITALLVAAAVKAAVSQVTLFSDRARVQRVASVPVEGRTRVELPLLPDSVDPSSIRLEVQGAEVQMLDIQRVQPDDFPVTEARALLDQLDRLDDKLRRLADEQRGLRQHLAAIRRIAPEIRDEPLRPRPKLEPRAWGQALAFAQGAEKAVQTRMRDGALQADELRRERQALAEKAQVLGGAARRSGYRAVAQLDGHGTARLTLTYLAGGARWAPGYDLQLLADQKSVRVSFSGAASQETGEDWEGAAMTMSTAVPATVRSLPEIATWKIGEKERFIPTPWRADRPPIPLPPRAAPPEPPMPSAADQLRQELLSRVRAPEPAAPEQEAEEGEVEVPGSVARDAGGPEMKAPVMPAPVQQAPPPAQKEAARRRAPAAAPAPVAANEVAVTGARIRAEQVGIAPPRSWQRPVLPPDSPAELAGGIDLEFPSVHRETVRSGKGARRVLLFTETWPVATERLLFPALSPEAYLVAEIRNPSSRTLPRGRAALTVGADPSGTAIVPLVAPGQQFTLPLGVDRAVRSFRNVAQVQGEKGLFSKDDVTRYAVTIEVQNPYPVPLPLKVVDQLPLQGDKNLEVELVEAQGAQREEGTGKLTWRLSAPASGKVKLAFVYQLKRPKGYRVHQ